MFLSVQFISLFDLVLHNDVEIMSSLQPYQKSLLNVSSKSQLVARKAEQGSVFSHVLPMPLRCTDLLELVTQPLWFHGPGFVGECLFAQRNLILPCQCLPELSVYVELNFLT